MPSPPRSATSTPRSSSSTTRPSDGSADVAARQSGVTVVRNDGERGLRPGHEPGAGRHRRARAHRPQPRHRAAARVARRRWSPRSTPTPTPGVVVPRLLNTDGTRPALRLPVPVACGSLRPSACRVACTAGRSGAASGWRVSRRTTGPAPVDWAIGAVHCIRAAPSPAHRRTTSGGSCTSRTSTCAGGCVGDGWAACWFAAARQVPHVGNAGRRPGLGASTARPAGSTPPTSGTPSVHGPVRCGLWAAVNTLPWSRSSSCRGDRAGAASPRGRAARGRGPASSAQWMRLHGRKLRGGADAPLLPSQDQASGGAARPAASTAISDHVGHPSQRQHPGPVLANSRGQSRSHRGLSTTRRRRVDGRASQRARERGRASSATPVPAKAIALGWASSVERAAV